MRLKLGIVATHPIQYQAPWFRALASHPCIDLEVLFGHRATPQDQADAGFGVAFDWDTPLLDGYRYRFLNNVAIRPSPDRFFGIDTPEIGALIARNEFDVVILACGWYVKSSWQTILACWKKRTPVMVRGDSNLRTHRSVFRSALKTLPYRCFIPRFDACLSVGKWSEQYFLRYGAPTDRVFFVPHVVDEERFAARLGENHLSSSVCRQRLRLGPSAVVFLYCGKLIPKKRPLDFVRAIARAKKSAPDVQGLIVGDGPMRTECETLVRELGAPVQFAGFLNQSQLIDAYIAADSLVLPSDSSETWGLVVNEAMSCSKPCIVSDQVGCGPDLIVPGVTGDRFPCGDVARLSDRFVSYAKNASGLASMGENARNHITRYSVRAAVDGVLQASAAVMETSRLSLQVISRNQRYLK